MMRNYLGRTASVIGFVAIALGAQQQAAAQSSAATKPAWLSAAATCDDLKAGIRKEFGIVRDRNEIPEAKRAEFALVVEEACGPRFIQCGFRICGSSVSASSLSTSAASSASSSSISAEELRKRALLLESQIAEQLELNELSRPDQISSVSQSESVAVSSVFSQAAASMLAASSVDVMSFVSSSEISVIASEENSSLSDAVVSSSSIESTASVSSEAVSSARSASAGPLGWLDAELSCDALREQIAVRYEMVGGYDVLPPAKQEEYRKVHEIACGPRFQQCAIASCAILDPAELYRREMVKYEARVQELRDKRQKLIDEQQQVEKSSGAMSWQRFTVVEEEPEPKKREEPPRREPEARRPSKPANEIPDAMKPVPSPTPSRPVAPAKPKPAGDLFDQSPHGFPDESAGFPEIKTRRY